MFAHGFAVRPLPPFGEGRTCGVDQSSTDMARSRRVVKTNLRQYGRLTAMTRINYSLDLPSDSFAAYIRQQRDAGVCVRNSRREQHRAAQLLPGLPSQHRSAANPGARPNLDEPAEVRTPAARVLAADARWSPPRRWRASSPMRAKLAPRPNEEKMEIARTVVLF